MRGNGIFLLIYLGVRLPGLTLAELSCVGRHRGDSDGLTVGTNQEVAVFDPARWSSLASFSLPQCFSCRCPGPDLQGHAIFITSYLASHNSYLYFIVHFYSLGGLFTSRNNPAPTLLSPLAGFFSCRDSARTFKELFGRLRVQAMQHGPATNLGFGHMMRSKRFPCS